MSSQKLIIVAMLFVILGGCGQLSPYIDRQRNAGAEDISQLYSGPSTPENPVVCYNALLTSDETLQQLADAECVKYNTGKKAEFIKKTHLEGKLLLPSHAYYKCVK